MTVSGLMGSVDAVWLNVFVRGFLNRLARAHVSADAVIIAKSVGRDVILVRALYFLNLWA